jgi:hypothetical protein
MLESMAQTTPHLLAVGVHTTSSTPTTQAFLLSILLLEDWPQRVFFNSNGQQFRSIDDIYISAGSMPMATHSSHRPTTTQATCSSAPCNTSTQCR